MSYELNISCHTYYALLQNAQQYTETDQETDSYELRPVAVDESNRISKLWNFRLNRLISPARLSQAP